MQLHFSSEVTHGSLCFLKIFLTSSFTITLVPKILYFGGTKSEKKNGISLASLLFILAKLLVSDFEFLSIPLLFSS